MLTEILNQIKQSFLKGFKSGLNLSRHGKLEAPKANFIIDEQHKNIAQNIFDSSCLALNETGITFPTFFLLKEKQFMPVMMDPKTIQKTTLRGYASMVMNLADEQNADAMMFISEQWQIKRELTDEETEQYISGKLHPSLDQDRQEVLTLIYLTSTGEMTSLIGEIERSIDNTPFVRESKWSDQAKQDQDFFQPWR